MNELPEECKNEDQEQEQRERGEVESERMQTMHPDAVEPLQRQVYSVISRIPISFSPFMKKVYSEKASTKRLQRCVLVRNLDRLKVHISIYRAYLLKCIIFLGKRLQEGP